MIVEDEFIIAEFIRDMLTRLDFEVVGIVSRGEDAAENVLIQNPDLILMDINLAGDIDGIEAIEEIKSKVQIPFIYVTASTDNSTMNRAMSTKPYGFITKPDICSENLLSSILIALERYSAEKRFGEEIAQLI